MNYEQNKLDKYILLCLVVVLCCINIFSNLDVLLGNGVLVRGDAQSSYYTTEYIGQSLQNGEIPLWNKYLANGTADVGALRSALNVFYYLGIVLEGAQVYFLFYVVFKVIGSAYVYKYLRQIQCRIDVSVLFAVLYNFSIHIGGQRTAHLTLIISITLFPVILYYLEKYYQHHKMRYILIIAMVMAIQFHYGFMQLCFYSDIAVFVYYVAKWFSHKENRIKGVRDGLICLATYIILIIGYVYGTLQLILSYSTAGANTNNWNYFASGSIHPIKWLMCFFPNLWDNVYTPLHQEGYGSSGLDIELYLGTFVTLLVLIAIRYCMHNKRVRLPLLFMGGVALFSMVYYIGPLGKVLYRIPLLGMFRMPSRALFILIFFGYVVAAIVLDTIIKEKRYRVLTRSMYVLCGVLGVLYVAEKCCTNSILHVNSWWESTKYVFLIILLIAIFIEICVYGKEKIVFHKYGATLLCVIVAVFTICQVWTYHHVEEASDDKEKLFPVETIIKKELGNGKLLQASKTDISYVDSIVNYNRGEYTQMPQINAEMAFNNPKLVKLLNPYQGTGVLLNQTNALTTFPNVEYSLMMQNDALSMLGVKYICDTDGLFDKGDIYTWRQDELAKPREVLHIKSIDVLTDMVGIAHSQPILLESNKYYVVSFEYECVEWDYSIYFDFCGAGYDNNEQNITLNGINNGNGKCSVIVYSGNLPTDIETYFRIISNGTTDLYINNLIIQEINTSNTNAYQVMYQDEEITVYENNNVQDILYVPEQVKRVDSIDIVYDIINRCPLDKVSYVCEGQDFTPASTILKNIEWKNNNVEANVVADGDSFIVFSQNYSDDWKVYIDGIEADNIIVNDLIQGVYVTEGDHIVKFKYEPVDLCIVYIINFVAFAITVLIIMYSSFGNKKRGKQ